MESKKQKTSHYFITAEEAEKRGMAPHAGPYNMKTESVMIGRCIEDFRRQPKRKFALVETLYRWHEKTPVSQVSIWADGQTEADFMNERAAGCDDAGIAEIRKQFGL